MYGAYEAWDGSGIHLSESGVNGFPIKELSNGVAVQLQWKGFYGDAEYTYSSCLLYTSGEALKVAIVMTVVATFSKWQMCIRDRYTSVPSIIQSSGIAIT